MGKEKICIRRPEDAWPVLRKYANKRQEHFVVVTLNSGHAVIRAHCVTIGLANKTLVHPRECFFPAIKDNAAAVLCAHNHPGGSVYPSSEDYDITEKLAMSSQILGFHFLDHIIFAGKEQYYSFRQTGKIKDEFEHNELEQYVAEYVRKYKYFVKDLKLCTEDEFYP
jgi:DNA repair protein RadC